MADLPMLNFRQWYKAVFALGGALVVAGGAQQDPVPVVVGAGCVLLGVGEWINHPFRTRIEFIPLVGPSKISGESRSNTVVGVLLALAGVVLIGLGLFALVQRLDFNPRRQPDAPPTINQARQGQGPVAVPAGREPQGEAGRADSAGKQKGRDVQAGSPARVGTPP